MPKTMVLVRSTVEFENDPMLRSSAITEQPKFGFQISTVTLVLRDQREFIG